MNLKRMYKTASTLFCLIILLSTLRVTVCHAVVDPVGNGKNEEAMRNEVTRLLEWSYACRSYKTDKIDADFTLQMDIDLTGFVWVPIGDWTIPYTGVFNGNGHKITGLYVEGKIESGFFGAIGGGGVVKDLYIEGIITGSGVTGGICGINKGGRIEGCRIVNAVVESRQRFTTGGVCGSNTKEGIVLGCVVQNTEIGCVRAGSSSAGIVGVNQGLIAACSIEGGKVGSNAPRIPVGAIAYKNNGRIVACVATPQKMGKTSPFPGGITYENAGYITYSLWKRKRAIPLGITEELNPYFQESNCIRMDEGTIMDEHLTAMNSALKKAKIHWRWTASADKEKYLQAHRVK